MNILIVDDEHILLKFMEKRIKELMPKAVIASFDNCQDAINYAENNIINIINNINPFLLCFFNVFCNLYSSY